jgi:hypothetical protein
MRPVSTTTSSGSLQSSGTANTYICRVSATSATSTGVQDQIAIETKFVQRRKREAYKAAIDSIHNSILSSGSSGGSGKAINPCIFLSATLPEFVGQGSGGSGRVRTRRGRPWVSRAAQPLFPRPTISAASRRLCMTEGQAHRTLHCRVRPPASTQQQVPQFRCAEAPGNRQKQVPTIVLYRGPPMRILINIAAALWMLAAVTVASMLTVAVILS